MLLKQNHLRLMAAAMLAAFTLSACGAAAAPTAATGGATQAVIATAVPTAAPVQPEAATQPETAVLPETAAKLNLNTATGDEYLAAIPGFPNRMVREFLEYRPYASIQQFRREIGKYVDAAQVTEWEQYVYVPVDVDQSDAATLQQLPGVDEAAAAALIAARPFGSNAAFLSKLAELAPNADTALAGQYLAAQ
jgi:DNA uptake protein ComE-like DNA-binding protein